MSLTAENLAVDIVRKLQAGGHIAYFAGGCVRDRLMNREPKDFDVATSAHPEQVLALFPRSQKVGVAFGVVIVRQNKMQVEVATFRSEGAYSDGRRPDSVSFTTPEIDAQRRDFTCNGIFYDPVAGTLHDYVGGQADIAGKTLRAIGEAAHRFAEDHLRMMRAVRFAAKLEFEIEPATLAAIREHVAKIQQISRERIGEELRLMLEHRTRPRAIRLLMNETQLLAQIWPAQHFFPQFHHFYPFVEGEMSRAVALAGIQLAMEEWPTVTRADPEKLGESLKLAFALSNEEAAEISWILRSAMQIEHFGGFGRAEAKHMLASPFWPGLWQLAANDSDMTAKHKAAAEVRIAQMRAEGVAPPPFVTGNDLIGLGAPPGPKFKWWLDKLYDRQLELEFPNREAALEAAKKLMMR